MSLWPMSFAPSHGQRIIRTKDVDSPRSSLGSWSPSSPETIPFADPSPANHVIALPHNSHFNMAKSTAAASDEYYRHHGHHPPAYLGQPAPGHKSFAHGWSPAYPENSILTENVESNMNGHSFPAMLSGTNPLLSDSVLGLHVSQDSDSKSHSTALHGPAKSGDIAGSSSLMTGWPPHNWEAYTGTSSSAPLMQQQSLAYGLAPRSHEQSALFLPRSNVAPSSGTWAQHTHKEDSTRQQHAAYNPQSWNKPRANRQDFVVETGEPSVNRSSTHTSPTPLPSHAYTAPSEQGISAVSPPGASCNSAAFGAAAYRMQPFAATQSSPYTSTWNPGFPGDGIDMPDFVPADRTFINNETPAGLYVDLSSQPHRHPQEPLVLQSTTPLGTYTPWSCAVSLDGGVDPHVLRSPTADDNRQYDGVFGSMTLSSRLDDNEDNQDFDDDVRMPVATAEVKDIPTASETITEPVEKAQPVPLTPVKQQENPKSPSESSASDEDSDVDMGTEYKPPTRCSRITQGSARRPEETIDTTCPTFKQPANRHSTRNRPCRTLDLTPGSSRPLYQSLKDTTMTRPKLTGPAAFPALAVDITKADASEYEKKGIKLLGKGFSKGKAHAVSGGEFKCENCASVKTPMWRRSEKNELLCNACGLFLRTHGRHRSIKSQATSTSKTTTSRSAPSLARSKRLVCAGCRPIPAKKRPSQCTGCKRLATLGPNPAGLPVGDRDTTSTNGSTSPTLELETHLDHPLSQSTPARSLTHSRTHSAPLSSVVTPNSSLSVGRRLKQPPGAGRQLPRGPNDPPSATTSPTDLELSLPGSEIWTPHATPGPKAKRRRTTEPALIQFEKDQLDRPGATFNHYEDFAEIDEDDSGSDADWHQ